MAQWAQLAQGPPTPALAHQFVDEKGFVWLTKRNDFINHFAGDVTVAARCCTPCSNPSPRVRSTT